MDSPALGALFGAVIAKGASDLHISESGAAFLRLNGALSPFALTTTPEQLFAELRDVLGPERSETLKTRGDVDLGVSALGERFRVHIFRESGRLGVAIRHLPSAIPTPEELGVPDVVRQWIGNQTGLIIVTGPTGSGKSTTLASLANMINQEQSVNIVTIEDPVEYRLPEGLSRVSHREVGSDTSGFARAVRAGLREDVDVMVIGEMRDSDTIEAALSVAETGHLVFATLHTNNTAQAVDRLVDAFPPEQQSLTRSRLSACLLGVVYQRLLPSASGGRVAAFEVLVGTSAVRNLIREGKTYQIPNVIETARSEGMQSMAHGLLTLAESGRIDRGQVDDFLARNV